jgi:hypothetical protein
VGLVPGSQDKGSNLLLEPERMYSGKCEWPPAKTGPKTGPGLNYAACLNNNYCCSPSSHKFPFSKFEVCKYLVTKCSNEVVHFTVQWSTFKAVVQHNILTGVVCSVSGTRNSF